MLVPVVGHPAARVARGVVGRVGRVHARARAPAQQQEEAQAAGTRTTHSTSSQLYAKHNTNSKHFDLVTGRCQHQYDASSSQTALGLNLERF